MFQAQLSRFFFALATLWCASISAASPSQANNEMLATRIALLLTAPGKHAAASAPVLHVNILTSAAQLAKLCPEPELRLPGQMTRLTGNRSVIARCATQQHFIQVHVSATGTWWIATQTLSPGQTITTNDIQPHHGELEHLPADIILDADRIVGSTPTRFIRPGQPLAESQLRKNWAITAGEEVDIIAAGEGFSIHAKGKALDNAALNETLRVHTRTGQMITATATGNEKVTINLKE